MKKIIASAVGLAMVGGVATTAFAVENQFGGYWRTRVYVQDNATPSNDDSQFIQDNRTRLYYTAKFSDDFKFVNKFEFNSAWGDNNGGDIGADGTGHFRVKNSYADFNLGAVNTKVGIMGASLARGFLFDDDFSGILVTPSFGGNSVTAGYMSISNSDLGDSADDYGNDSGMAVLKGKIAAGDNMTITPYFLYEYASDATLVSEVLDGDTVTVAAEMGDVELFYLGADFDVNFGAGSAWATLIYNGGTMGDDDVNAFLAAAGVEAGVAHGQFIYATGDDNASDGDIDAFVTPAGSSYYWSEILGYGIFDNTTPINGRSAGYGDTTLAADDISNIIALNAGVTLNPSEKVKISLDAWYAALAEENSNGDDYIGVELDGVVTYQILDNLTADFVLAYLIAGDVVEEDVTEAGVRLSLKF